MTEEKKKVDFRFEHFNTSNTNDLIDIYEKCFGRKPDANYFQWKLNDNPAGRAEAYIALDGSTIAGFYGVIPEDYLVNGKKMTFYQSMDTMTHPDYRRMGLFTNLAKATYKHLIDRDGATYIIGFPGLTSHPGFVKKLGWDDAMAVRFYFINRTVFKAQSLFKKSPKFEIEPCQRFDNPFRPYFADRTASSKPISKFVDIDTLNWRYFDGPLLDFKCISIKSSGRIIGFVIYKTDDEGRGFLQYISALDPQHLPQMVYAAVDHIFDTLDCSSIYVFESTDLALQQAIRRSGFMHNPIGKGPFSYRPPIILYSNKEAVNGIPFFDIQNWEVQAVLRDY